MAVGTWQIDRVLRALCEAAYQQRVPLFAQGFYRTPDIHFDSKTGRGRPFHYFAFGAAVSEVEVDGFTGQLPAAAHRHPAGRRRLDLADRRSRPDRRRIHPGRGLADARRAALGRARARRDRPARPPTSCRRGRRCPTSSKSTSSSARPQPGVVLGSKAVGEPPLMLAISVREAIRDAVAAFGPGDRVDLRQLRRRPSACSSRCDACAQVAPALQ